MKINFIPFANYLTLKPPSPAIQNLPDWYKQKKPLVNTNKFRASVDGSKNVSVKWCNPFGDSLGAGYFVFLEVDVQVSKENGEHSFMWLTGGDEIISLHSKDQISPELIPYGYSPQPFKFRNFWGVKTPPGYSTLFTHPHNRFQNDWFTLSGIVDTDSYNTPVNLPFVIREDFEGIIEAGTPIAQLIPFKRDSWSSKHLEFDGIESKKMLSDFAKTIFRPYKRFHWKRKEWK